MYLAPKTQAKAHVTKNIKQKQEALINQRANGPPMAI